MIATYGPEHVAFAFGEYRLDRCCGLLFRDRLVVLKLPSVVRLLDYVVANRHRPVSFAELALELWESRPPSRNNISQHVYLARRALDDLASPHRFIENVRGYGYRFSASLAVEERSIA